MLIFTRDKVRLEEHFRRDPVRFAYHLGDLDDFLFDRCQWGVSYYKSTRIDECILIYHAPHGSVVLAFGLSERFEGLLGEAVDLLPDAFECHFQAEHRSILARSYREEQIGTGVRMGLGHLRVHHDQDDLSRIRRLGRGEIPELNQFYRDAYPEGYFEDRMVETGKFLGWMEGDQLAAVAGVHVYSPAFKVAVLGSIATHPDYRGRGLATKLTSQLAAELAGEGLTVCLNVMVDNAPALRCYEKLGFERAFEYEAVKFALK